MRIRAVVLLASLVVVAGAAAAPHMGQAAERRAVEQAVLDYVDALYHVDATRIERSVHRSLTKVGFSRGPSGQYSQVPMTWQQLHDLAGRWNAGRTVNPATARRQVVVLDVLDQTASAKLVAEWGIDYMHLAKYGGRWQIVHVLWQSHPVAGE